MSRADHAPQIDIGPLTIDLIASFHRAFDVVARVELSVFADNGPALALYEKVGFVREGIVRDAVCIDRHTRDVIAMAMVRRTTRRPDTRPTSV